MSNAIVEHGLKRNEDTSQATTIAPTELHESSSQHQIAKKLWTDKIVGAIEPLQNFLNNLAKRRLEDSQSMGYKKYILQLENLALTVLRNIQNPSNFNLSAVNTSRQQEVEIKWVL